MSVHKEAWEGWLTPACSVEVAAIPTRVQRGNAAGTQEVERPSAAPLRPEQKVSPQPHPFHLSRRLAHNQGKSSHINQCGQNMSPEGAPHPDDSNLWQSDTKTSYHRRDEDLAKFSDTQIKS